MSTEESTPLNIAERFLDISLALALLSTLWVAALRIPFPYQLDYGEGAVLYGARQLAAGQALYPAVGNLPVSLSPYGPAGFMFFAGPVEWFGAHFAGPRLLVFLCTLSIAALLAALLRRWTGSWRVSVIFGLLFVSVPLLRNGWAYFVRVDIPGLLLETLGLLVVALWPRKWLLAVPLFVLALAFKVSLVAAPVACIAYFALRRQWTAAAGLAASVLALAAALFWWGQQATGGALFQHLLYSHAGNLRPRQFFALFLPAFAAYSPILALGLYRLFHAWADRTFGLFDLYFLASSLLLVTAAKPGSAHNHFLGWFSALCLIAALAYHDLRREAALTRAFALFPATIGILLLLNVDIRALPRESKDCAEANAYLRDHPGAQVLSENIGALLLTGRKVWLSDPSGYTLMVHWENWDDRELVEKASRKFFDLIILSEEASRMSARPHSVWPRRFLAEVEKNYQPVRYFTCNNTAVFYQPSPQRPLPSPSP